MADIKSVQIEFLLGLTSKELQLVVRCLGLAIGVEVTFTQEEHSKLKELNVKICKMREIAFRQLADTAARQLEAAEGVESSARSIPERCDE